MYFLLAALFYFSLITGGVIAFIEIETNYVIAKIICLVSLICVLPAALRSKNFVKTSFIFGLTASPILLVAAIRSDDLSFASQKFDAIIFGSLSSAAILHVMMRRIGEDRSFDRIITVGLAALGATLFYKGTYGFWDREVRFFLNGPIVFGWLMGAMCILSCFRLFTNGGRRYVLASALFFSATLWTMSKGAILALSLAISFLMLTYCFQRKISLAKLGVIVAGLLLVIVFFNVSNVDLESTRLSAFSRILTSATDKNDEGSIGARLDMLNQSAEVIKKHYLMGVGLGSWKSATGSEFNYPHNIYAEIAAELGLPISMALLLWLCTILMELPPHIRVLALFFLIASGFSGDSSYLRFPLAFMLASWAARSGKNETNNPSIRSRNKAAGHRFQVRFPRVGRPKLA